MGARRVFSTWAILTPTHRPPPAVQLAGQLMETILHHLDCATHCGPLSFSFPLPSPEVYYWAEAGDMPTPLRVEKILHHLTCADARRTNIEL